MYLTLSPREQSAFRRVLLAVPHPTGIISLEAASALTTLIPCDWVGTCEGDSCGYVLRGAVYPEAVPPDLGPRICDGPLHTGLEHFATFSEDDPELVSARGMGLRDGVRLGYTSPAGTVVQVFFDRRRHYFGERDLAILSMLEPVLGRLLTARQMTAPSPLTDAERRVLTLVAQGLTNSQVAEELFVAESTVRKHLQHAFRKLGVTNRTGALAVLTQSF